MCAQVDFANIAGNNHAKRAIEVAASVRYYPPGNQSGWIVCAQHPRARALAVSAVALSICAIATRIQSSNTRAGWWLNLNRPGGLWGLRLTMCRLKNWRKS